MSTPSQSFLFNETAGGSKTGQTLPIGAQISAQAVPTAPASDVANIEPAGAAITGASIPTGGVGLTGWLSAIWAKLSATISVKSLLAAGVSRALTTASSSVDTALTAGIKAVTIYARNSDAYFSIGNVTQTASSASVFIASGERLDFDVSGYATPHIGVIFGPSAAAAVLQITELA